MLKRDLFEKIYETIKKTPKSVGLIGPRQTGKSTLLKALNPRLVINLSDESTYRAHLKDPDLLGALVRGQPGEAAGSILVMIDEIQRIPSLLNTVQALLDTNPKYRFLLTGSSARKLKRGQANLLPGRVFWYHLHPLTYQELQADFHLERALTRGCLPEVYLQEFGPELLSNYVDTYLREEIQAEAVVRHIDSYARFLDVAAECSGREINYSQIASDTEIPKETLRRFYDVLADTIIVQRLPGFSGIKGSRKAVQKEKFIFFDMGVRNSVLNQHRNKFTSTQLGELFEQWFILQVIAYSDYHTKNWRFSYYRDDLKQEVDLIVDMGSNLLAIEIKYATTYKSDFSKGLLAFMSYAKKPTQGFIIFRGQEIQVRQQVQIVPYDLFLTSVLPLL